MGLSDEEHFSDEVDETLLRFMDELELLEEKRAAMNALIEQGWFSIAKARYSMGNKQVSPLQYANEMEPLLCVHTQSPDNGVIKFSSRKANEKSDDNLKPVEVIGPQDTGVRRRNITKHGDDEKESSEKAPESNETAKARKSESNPQQDPLRWFGILVPQSLKQAQTSFKQVIELSAEIATLQTSILNTRQELHKLMEKKLHDPSD